MENYRKNQIEKIENNDTFKIKIESSDDSTKWLNITYRELLQIKNILCN